MIDHISDKKDKQEMQGRFKIYFDFDYNTWWFITEWNGNKQNRTITEDQKDILKDIMMGGHIQAMPAPAPTKCVWCHGTKAYPLEIRTSNDKYIICNNIFHREAADASGAKEIKDE